MMLAHALLLVLVLGVVAIAIGVDLAALWGCLRR
jgi:hypothetical protein